MERFEMSEKYMTGIKSVDEEHTKFLDMINELYDALEKGNSAELKKIFFELATYADTHFSNEEVIFTSAEYPDAAEHMRIHGEFRGKLRDLVISVKNGNSRINLDLLLFMKDWLFNHILGTDMKFAWWLKRNRK